MKLISILLSSLFVTAFSFASFAFAAEPAHTKKAAIPTNTSTPITSPGMIDQAKAMGNQASEKALVNLNSAPVTDLEKVPGLTPENAKQIVANRPYGSVSELSKVKGLKQDLIAKIKPYVTTK